MSEFISVPLKKTVDVDVVKPLKNILSMINSPSQKPQDLLERIKEFGKLRTNAVRKPCENQYACLEVMYTYYDQLNALENKLPAGELQIPFKWKDAFSKNSIFGGNISLTISNIGYEKMCVLFNIASFQSLIAASQTIGEDEGLKMGARMFQQSAGIFSHLKNNVMTTLQQDPTPDLSPDTVTALSTLMLAQAQEMFVHKATLDNMKNEVIAKISNETAALYDDALKLLQKENVKHLWGKEWILTVSTKQAMFRGLADFYQGLVCKSNKAIGEQIARLQCAMEHLKSAQTRGQKLKMMSGLLTTVDRMLKEATKDNDFIYHEKVPDGNSLSPIGRAALAKPLPLPQKMSSEFKDLFDQLLPVPVHQAITAFENRKNEFINSEVLKLREATQLLNGILASLNLPAALEDSGGQEIPRSLVYKSNIVKDRGGPATINRMLSQLPELLARDKAILEEIEKMMTIENETDTQLRIKFKARWTRIPSARLTWSLRTNVEKYKTTIARAMQADKVVKEKFEKHKSGIELLNKGPATIAEALPQTSCGNVDENSSCRNQLRQHMEQVEVLKAERDTIEIELKSTNLDMKDTFMAALIAGNINEQVLSEDALERNCKPIKQKVQDSLAKQKILSEDIQKVSAEFLVERAAQDNAAHKREEMLKGLATAFDAYMELTTDITEGIKFYSNLIEILLAFQNKVSDFCFARKTEEEELLKELTKEIKPEETKATTASANRDDLLHTKLINDSSQNPHLPLAACSTTMGLPYPTQTPSMPSPYVSQIQPPYPQYYMPPMPTGYYLMPCPSSYQPPPPLNPAPLQIQEYNPSNQGGQPPQDQS